MLSLPFIIQILGSNPWLVNRPEDILFSTKDPLSHIIIADFLACVSPGFSRRKRVSYASYAIQCQTPRCYWETARVRWRKCWICSYRGAESKSPGKLGDRWSIGWGYLLLADHSWYDRMLITCCRITTSVLLCGSMPFREDSMTEVIRQMTDDGGEGEIPR